MLDLGESGNGAKVKLGSKCGLFSGLFKIVKIEKTQKIDLYGDSRSLGGSNFDDFCIYTGIRADLKKWRFKKTRKKHEKVTNLVVFWRGQFWSFSFIFPVVLGEKTPLKSIIFRFFGGHLCLGVFWVKKVNSTGILKENGGPKSDQKWPKMQKKFNLEKWQKMRRFCKFRANPRITGPFHARENDKKTTKNVKKHVFRCFGGRPRCTTYITNVPKNRCFLGFETQA